MTRRRDALAALVIFAATLAYALVVIRDFSGPLINGQDTNGLELYGYLMEQNLSFGWLPHLAFSKTTEVMYPFGTLVVFVPWGVERDVFYALLHGAFGHGPWLQLYQTAGMAISAAGTYVLLRREDGQVRALLVALAGTFMAFYAIYKYPHHLNVMTTHWTVLSIVVDFIMFRRLVGGGRWCARLVLARVALLLLVFGLDLGYVAGFALLSFTTTGLAALIVVVRARRRGEPVLARVLPRAPLRELRAHPAQSLLLVALIALPLWLYLPIVAQIVLATRHFRFGGPGGSFWASQFRILLPYLPLVGPPSDLVHRIFGDAEGIGEFSAGWALLGAAALGLRDAKRRRELVIYAPIVVAFVLCLLYHPRRFPTLRIFPWFQFNRVAGRATLFFPIWLSLLALGWRPDLRLGRARRFAFGLAALAVIETVTAYASFRYRVFSPDASFYAYMRTVREAPGEAVLDWPFCIAGGNGVATPELCPLYMHTSTTYAYLRFHKKRVVGLLLSRMTEPQVKPFVDLGMPSLFMPDDPDVHLARRQTRCFDDRQWALFERFYRSHDFAGINLYPDLLAPGCDAEFFARFGPPVAETHLPAEGRALFIPRR